MTNNHDIGKAFEKFVSENWIIYGGLRWEKTPAGFVHNGFLARDHSEMDLLVNHERDALANTLINTRVQ